MIKSALLTVIFLTSIIAHGNGHIGQNQADDLLLNKRPAVLDGVGIEEKIGAKLSKDIELMNEEGNPVALSSFLTGNKPILLTLVYYTCPSLCNLHLNGLMDGLKEVNLIPGRDYEMVAVSFEPTDTPEIAKAKKANYLKYLDKDEEFGKGLHFLTGSKEQVQKLADEVGFQYKWDPASKQWAHGSAAIFLTPDEKIARYIHGVYFEPRTLKLSLIETSQGKTGNLVDQIALFCFNYDAKENRYAIAAFNVMRLGGAVTVLLLAMWLIPFWLKNRKART